MTPFEKSPGSALQFTTVRQDDRRPLRADATIRNITQGRIGGRLIDIAENGCKIELFNASATRGQKVTIKLDNLELWVGYIRWVKGRVIGVEFDRPMHPAVVDHLSSTHPELDLA